MKNSNLRLFLIAALALQSCKDPEYPSYPVIAVVQDARTGATIPGVPVAMNAEDGTLLADGVTDAQGTFFSPSGVDVPAGSSVSVSVNDAHLGYVLHTTYDIQPGGGTYRFYVNSRETSYGTLDIRFTSPPDLAHRFHVGACEVSANAGVARVSLPIKRSCLESDGSLSLYGEAVDSATGETKQYTLVTGLTLAQGETLVVSANDWLTVDRFQYISFVNGPNTIEEAQYSWTVFRKGATYSLLPSRLGIRSSNRVEGAFYQYGTSLPYRTEGNKGFGISFLGRFASGRGSTYGGFVRRSALPIPSTLDLKRELPNLNLQASFNFDDVQNWELQWTAPAGTFDGAVFLTQWQEPDQGPRTWIAKSSHDLGRIVFPQLPASMAYVHPTAKSEFGIPIALVVKTSWRTVTGYSSFATDENPLPLIPLYGTNPMGILGSTSDADLSFMYALTLAEGSHRNLRTARVPQWFR